MKRTVFPEVPPRVEYQLTTEGKTLLPLLGEIAKWGRKMGAKHGKVEAVASEEKLTKRAAIKART